MRALVRPASIRVRCATLLPSGRTLFAEQPLSLPPVVPIQSHIFDPDPAIVRAGLAGQLAMQLGAPPIDNKVALFTGKVPISSPFVAAYRVEFAERYDVRKLRDQLKAGNVSRVTIVKRGSLIDADEMLGKLKLAGSEHRVVLLTRAAGEQVMIVCERLTAASV